MHPLELIIALMLVTGALAFIASRLRVPYPIFLVIGGAALSLFPNLPRVALEPDIVFLLFLPPLLYFAGLQTSWRDFKANARPIALLAIGCVLFTMLGVAAVAVFVFEMPWAPALVLGAVVSPPDAVAATAIMSRLRIPRRIITILEGESLVNDATALVAYKFAIAAVVTGAFSLPAAIGQFFILALGGIALGLVVGVVVAWVRPRLKDESVESVVSLLTPYIAYLPAEHLGVSGVLAAVTAGIYLGRQMPRITQSRTRLKLTGAWEVLVFLLNALVFILIGLQLHDVIERLRVAPHLDRAQLIWGALIISIAAVVVRMLWVYPATYLPRRIFSYIARREPPPAPGPVFMIAWTGMRGIVSLAAALAIPTVTAAGLAFPHRDLIIFITFAVILFTLIVQGLSLPFILRRLHLGADVIGRHEELRARYEAAHAALVRIETLVALGEALPDMADRLAEDFRWQARELGRRLSKNHGTSSLQSAIPNPQSAMTQDSALIAPHLSIPPDPTLSDLDGDPIPTCATLESLQFEALDAQKRMILKLRDDSEIGDEVLRKIMVELDHEESRLHRPL